MFASLITDSPFARVRSSSLVPTISSSGATISRRIPRIKSGLPAETYTTALLGEILELSRGLPNPELVDQHPQASGAVLVVADALRENVD